jgi:hypothetical protein
MEATIMNNYSILPDGRLALTGPNAPWSARSSLVLEVWFSFLVAESRLLVPQRLEYSELRVSRGAAKRARKY